MAINLPMGGIDKVRPALITARSWAIGRLRDPGNYGDPPWQWYQMMKLRETINALLGDVEDPTAATEGSLEPAAAHQERADLQGERACRTGTSPLHLVSEPEPPPMSQRAGHGSRTE